MSEMPSLPLFERGRKLVKGLALPVLAIVLWQWAGENGAVAGGALPTRIVCGKPGLNGGSAIRPLVSIPMSELGGKASSFQPDGCCTDL